MEKILIKMVIIGNINVDNVVDMGDVSITLELWSIRTLSFLWFFEV